MGESWQRELGCQELLSQLSSRTPSQGSSLTQGFMNNLCSPGKNNDPVNHTTPVGSQQQPIAPAAKCSQLTFHL